MQKQLATTPPSSHFTHSVAANVVYWRQRTQELADHNLPALDRDRQNLYRAARFGLHLADTWRETAELILQAFVLVERRGYWGEWIPMLERLLDKCSDDDLALRGRILDHLGLFYRHNRQLGKALLAHQEELQIGMDLQDKWRQGHACINLGSVCCQMRRFDEAQNYILKAQKAFQAINAPLMKQAFVTLEFGLLTKAQEQWSVAEEYFRYSVSLWREVGDPVYLANSLKLLGQVLAAQNKTDEALKAYDEALDALSATENHLDKTRVRNELGILYFNQGQLAEAERLLRQADSSFLRQSGNLFDQAIVSINLGNVYLAQSQLKMAERSFQRSVVLWQTCDEPVQLANSLGGLAEVKTTQGEFEEAKQLYQRAIKLLADYPQDVWGQKLQKKFIEEENSLR